MKNLPVLMICLFAAFGLNAQEKGDTPQYGISFSGFVKTDFFYDFRQMVNIREGNFTLYPENVKPDLNGKDLNAKDQFGILSIQSRLSGKLTGPNVMNAKTSGLIEADFFGNENGNFSDVNGFRLRHALVRINWSSTELLAGQFWHPLFVHECFPDVVSFNTGAPFQPFSRNPQLRVTQKLNHFRLVGAIAGQRDFTSNGPEGSSSRYLRQSALPDLNLHLQFHQPWNEKLELLAGAGFEYKEITPRLFSIADKITSNGADSLFDASGDKADSWAAAAYAKLRLKPVTFKLYGIYGGNLFDLVMLGGYATGAITDTLQKRTEYMPVRTLSCWTEIQTNGKIQAGLFAGFSKNLGTDGENTGTYYSRGSNIRDIYRVSPRIVFNFEKLRIAAEIEYSHARYGKANKSGVVDTDLKDVSGLRTLVAFYYFF